MKLTEILNYIQQKLNEDPRVHDASIDDVYSHWNTTNSGMQYPSAYKRTYEASGRSCESQCRKSAAASV